MTEPKRKLRGLTDDSKVIVDYLPDAFEHVVVHCERYTCVGYLDDKGIWRGQFNDRPIGSRVIAWEPM